jgi:hypothetical protein
MTTTVFCYAHVKDFAFWRAGYARAVAAFPEIRSSRVWQGQDDPNYSITAETFDSREVAQRIFDSPETRRMMAADGIDMATIRIEYVDQVE